jgi:putative ABC transport system permease protein
MRYTNAEFWKVFDFNFLQGSSFTDKDLREKNNVVVISENLSKKLYGGKNAVGKTIELTGNIYRIIGVVENVSSLARNSYAQVWIPYTFRDNPEFTLESTGAYSVAFRAKDKEDREVIKTKINEIRSKLDNMNGEDLDLIFAGPSDAMDVYFRGYRDPESYEGKAKNMLALAGKWLLILLLPALNLISLNLTRIQERSHEIAIRKAFGATKKNLAFQIIAENAIITLIGGFIGLLLAYGAAFLFKGQIFTEFYVINSQNVQVEMNYGIFFILIIVSLILSILSGLIPAIRMSKLQPAMVLKGGEL